MREVSRVRRREGENEEGEGEEGREVMEERGGRGRAIGWRERRVRFIYYRL